MNDEEMWKIVIIRLLNSQFLIVTFLLILAFFAHEQRELIIGGVLGFLTNESRSTKRSSDSNTVVEDKK